MCQIISGPSNLMRSTLLNTSGLIESLFKSNSDGLGMAYRNKRGLKIVKAMPKSVLDVRHIIENMPDDDRPIVQHWRFATHGTVNIQNVHPYVVVPGKVALVHNGILETGNDKDRTRSDTHHFVQDFLAGLVGKYPDIIHDDSFKKMLGDTIGNNRFVFMDNEGKLSIVNEDQGVKHGELWFANTYAWDPSLLIKGYRSRYHSTHSITQAELDAYKAAWDGFDEDAYDSWKHERSAGPTWGPNREANFLKAVADSAVDVVADCLEDYADDALAALFDRYVVMENRHTDSTRGVQAEIVEALVDQNMAELRHQCRVRPEILAEVLCYYVDVIDLEEWDAQQEDGTAVTYYRQHCITVSEDDSGWGFTVENTDDGVAYAGVQFEDADDARIAAMAWLDANAMEEA